MSRLMKALSTGKLTRDLLRQSEKSMLESTHEITADEEISFLKFKKIPNSIKKFNSSEGVFCVVSNELKSPESTLQLYIMSNAIECSLEGYKSLLDGLRPSIGDLTKIRGREFIKMIALCYQLLLQIATSNVKDKCYNLSCDENLSQELLNQYDALGKWLDKTSITRYA